jgi:hypothetical protein
MTPLRWTAGCGAALLCNLLLYTSPAATGAKGVEDHTKTDPASLGVKFVKPEKDDATGFVVGGKNPTDLIRTLTQIAGRKIAALEKDMRPGKLSRLGFLGKDEKLLDVLAEDNRYVVEELGLTHQELARHLHVVGAVAVRHFAEAAKAGRQAEEKEIAYHGRRFKVKAACFRGFQESPFDDGTKANCEATVINVATGKKLTYSLLVPHMIERYGFYEGKGTPYRVDPRAVLEVFDFLKPARPKDGGR